MSSRLKLAGICFAAAFALAACGGGGGSTAVNPDPPPMPTPPPAPTAESIKADAADAITAAIAAGMAAEQAKKDAAKYAGMLTTRAVDGDSAMAAANAQKVLDAEMAANAAVMAADEALQDAMAAKTAAEALAEDDAERAGAIAAAERAITDATKQKTAAMAIVDAAASMSGSLKASVQMVEGPNPKAEGYPTMPARKGEQVAEYVMMALGSPAVATDATNAPKEGAIMHDGAAIGAMTWAQIVGEDNVMDVRRLDDNAISQVKAMSVMGSMASGLAAENATLPNDSDSDATNGIQNNDGAMYDAMYKGIAGTVFCAGNDCGRDGDGNLTGSWYFTPGDTDELFVMGTGGSYMVATMYARYGAWLTYAGETDANPNGVSMYAAATANTTRLDLEQGGTPAADVTARYTGKAAGISVHNKASGRFTADVNLTAKFAAIPTLRGSISNFQGNAVGSWSVILNQANLDTAAASATGTTSGGGIPGAWTAQGYGPAPDDHDGDSRTDPVNQRPTGFVGTFNANFGDGMAAGGYATRKAE